MSISEVSQLLKEVEEEAQKGLSNEQQHVSEQTIKRVAKMIAKRLDKEIPEVIEEKDLKSKLGIMDFNTLKTLSKVSISGLKVNPFNTKGNQKVGADSTDVKNYEKVQVVPFLALNKEGETLSGSKGEEDFYVLFWLPALGIAIDKDNIGLHSDLFNLKKPEDGFTYKHVSIKDIPHYKITKDQFLQIQSDLRNGNLIGVNKMIRDNKGGKRKSTSRDEMPGQNLN